MVRVSAALIVRDEEAHLADCLATVSRVADEIVVVDTGSRDRTPDIALAYGARVFARPWTDDFSQARNAALECATGAWILYVDADERVELTGSLDAVLGNPAALAARVRFRASRQLTPYREHRLFRSRPDIRFRGVIHETILPDIRHLVAKGSGVVVEAPLSIDHLGYEGDRRVKHQRDLPLLRRAVVSDPERVFLWHALGEAEQALGNVEAAASAWRNGLQQLRRRPSRPGDVQIYSDLFDLHFADQGIALPDVEALLAEAAARHPDDPLVLWWTARHRASCGRFAAAREALQRLLHFGADGPGHGEVGYDRRLFGGFAWGLLGVCWFREGHPQRALEWLRLAEGAQPDNREIRVKRALAEAALRSRAV
jgi:tetratricopeptide (TPR) repeat protein